MSYNPNDAVLLKHLLDLGARVKKVTDNHETRIDTLEKVGAQANVIEGFQVNGDTISLVNKIANLLIAESTTNGSLSVNNKDVPIHGLAALAYKTQVSADDLAAALKKTIDDASSDISTLKGTGEGSVSKQITDAINKFATDVTDDNVVNSYKELIDWVSTHGAAATEMSAAITALQNKTVIGTHEVDDGEGGKKTVEYSTIKDYVEAVTRSFIALSALSAETTGSGNAVTGISYDPATGKTTATKGKTFAEAKVPAVADSIATLGADGQLKDSGVKFAADADVKAELDKLFAAVEDNG